MAKKEQTVIKQGPRMPLADFLATIGKAEVRAGFGAAASSLSSNLLTTDEWHDKLTKWLNSPA